jgi:hypothetical protein
VFLVFLQDGKARAKFIFLPRMFHTKVWNIGAGSAHKCGTTLTAVEWPTLFHTWVWNIYQQSLCIDVLAHELIDSLQQSISPPKTHEQN